MSPHTLRHTFGRSALDAGMGLMTVAALVDHESSETTAIFMQSTARDLEREVDRLVSD